MISSKKFRRINAFAINHNPIHLQHTLSVIRGNAAIAAGEDVQVMVKLGSNGFLLSATYSTLGAFMRSTDRGRPYPDYLLNKWGAGRQFHEARRTDIP